MTFRLDLRSLFSGSVAPSSRPLSAHSRWAGLHLHKSFSQLVQVHSDALRTDQSAGRGRAEAETGCVGRGGGGSGCGGGGGQNVKFLKSNIQLAACQICSPLQPAAQSHPASPHAGFIDAPDKSPPPTVLAPEPPSPAPTPPQPGADVLEPHAAHGQVDAI